MRMIFAFLVVIVSVAAAAAQTEAPKKGPAPKNREEFMHKILQLALTNIGNARCGTERCTAATDAEKKNPPISLSETSQIVGRGIFSGGASYCGMDWEKRNFQPMMAYWREEKKKNERQLALIAMIHGMMFEQILSDFSIKGKCPDEIKNDLEKRLDFKPQS